MGHFQKYHNTLCLPSKILHKHCFQFLMGPTMVPRENKNNAYAKFWRPNKEYYGSFESGLFKALAKQEHTSAIVDHIKATGHNIKWDHFEILASGRTDYHSKIKETLFIQELNPTLNTNLTSEKLSLY